MRLPLWAWLYDLDTWEAREPRSIECQDCGETMHLHGGDETRIVRWFSRYRMLRDKSFPRWINSRRLGQE